MHSIPHRFVSLTNVCMSLEEWTEVGSTDVMPSSTLSLKLLCPPCVSMKMLTYSTICMKKKILVFIFTYIMCIGTSCEMYKNLHHLKVSLYMQQLGTMFSIVVSWAWHFTVSVPVTVYCLYKAASLSGYSLVYCLCSPLSSCKG